MAFSTAKTSPISTAKTETKTTSFGERLWNKYTDALIARPLLVKCGTASFIFLISDAMTQKLLFSSKSSGDDDVDNDNNESFIWDYNRSLSGAGFGIIATCWLHYWWGFLEIVVNKRIPISSRRHDYSKLMNTLGKVIIDQLIGAPIYIYSYYCVTHFGKKWMDTNKNIDMNLQPNNNNNNNATTTNNNTSRSKSTIELMTETSNRAIDLLPGTMIRHWTIWPTVHTLNFYYNPIHHRVLVQNVVLIFWSGYLSHLNNGGLQLPVQVAENSANTNRNHNKDLHLITPEEEVEMTALSLASASASASEQQTAMTTTPTSIKTRITKRIAGRTTITHLKRRYSSEVPLVTSASASASTTSR